LFICIGGTPHTGGAAGIGLATNAGAVRRHHLAVLTVDRGDDAGHRLACQQAAGHPQRVIDVRRRPTVRDQSMWRVYSSKRHHDLAGRS